MIKGSIQQENVTLYDPMWEHCIYKTDIDGQKGRNRQWDSNSRGLNTPLTSTDLSGEKINKETLALNDALDQMDLIDLLVHNIHEWQTIHSFQVHRLGLFH